MKFLLRDSMSESVDWNQNGQQITLGSMQESKKPVNFSWAGPKAPVMKSGKAKKSPSVDARALAPN
jgi:hypothetical protein